MNAYDEAIEVMARQAYFARTPRMPWHRASFERRSDWKREAADMLDALLAARYPSDCETCGGTGLDPDDPFDGQPSDMDLHGNLIYSDGYPCPSCRRLLDALGEERT